ncbi:Bug family tripartite tricarboxylate transporter substrate binding protein [Rhodoplanes sp. Z2-YC6860]|uniref:Bug family tripartite tricarboxylate transporter substrate binding protein n=1 Tax=Rhodoplanes sp. Z2-YC6860 TaxID=674703 RepID=UPI00078DB69B|nr:tripartite tricarboxylate transporter substrate-binding protein [Rhodoplanes sp. Z2-YC6860]AMN41135.1 extracytoplasmic binding receptor [Rhodoplanes sp. Z2-YC6860]
MMRAVALVAAMLAVAGTAPACAQPEPDQYPSRPVKLVVPFPAGVLTDFVARTFADKLSTQLGKPVLIENKPGAGGALGVKSVATADPDGYTLLFTNSQYAIAPAVYKSLGYDPLADLAGIAMVAESPSAVIVSPKMGVKTLKEFIHAARSQPEAFVYASAGTGSQTHLAAAYFSSQADINLVHLPYRNTGSIIADMIAGRTHATFAPPGFLLGQIQSGDLLALAVTSRQGMTEPIKAPSVSEAAIPGYEYSTWFGFFAPSRTSAAILNRLAAALHAATEEADLKEKFLKSAVIMRFMQLKDFDAFVKADIEKQAQIVKTAGIAPQ